MSTPSHRAHAIISVTLAMAFVHQLFADPPQVKFLFKPDQPTLLNRPLSEFRDIVRSLTFWHGATWFGTYGGGLFELSAGVNSVKTRTHATSPLAEDRVNCLEPMGEDLWIGTCDGIDRIDGKTGAWKHFGVADGVAHTIYHVLRADRHGNLWVGTTGKGISRFDGKAWKSWGVKEGLPSGWVNDVLEDDKGVMWAATAGGVACLARDAKEWKPLEPKGAVTRIWSHATALAQRGSEIWVGTGGQGLLMTDGTYWYDPGGEAGLPSQEISGLLVDRAGALWIGTSKGLVCYRGPGEWKKYGREQGLVDPHVMVMREGGTPPRLWLGSYAGTILRYEPDRDHFTTIFNRGGLSK